jgi:hypothetical protein
MGEFEKNQDKTNQTDQQDGKPAFGQFDKEQGQQEQQGEIKQPQDELAGTEKQQDGDQNR